MDKTAHHSFQHIYPVIHVLSTKQQNEIMSFTNTKPPRCIIFVKGEDT